MNLNWAISTSVLIPIIVIISGLLFKYLPPKTINHFYGYRTRRSMINIATWRFAHAYAAKVFLKLGAALLVLSVAPWFFIDTSDIDVVMKAETCFCVLSVAGLVGAMLMCEHKLKVEFDEEGKRRH